MGRREVHVDQMELFTPTITNPRKRVDRKTTTAVRYVKYKVKKPFPCDYCKLNQVDDPHAPIARQARYRRVVNGEDTYLCVPHTNDQRLADGLKEIRVRR